MRAIPLATPRRPIAFGIAAIPLFALILVAAPLRAEYLLQVMDTETEPGVPFAMPVQGDWDDDVVGFQISLSFPAGAPVLGLGIDVSQTLVGELEPDFIIVNVDPDLGELVYAVLFDAQPPFTGASLPPVGFPLLVAELVGEVPAGTPDTDVLFEFVDGLGTPPIDNIFVVGTTSVPVTTLIDGTLSVRTPVPPPVIHFIRGDVNMDEVIDLADVIYHLNYTFQGGALPPCDDAADANDDGVADISDGIFVLDYLYSGGPNPWPPFPAPGPDPTADGIGCENPL